MLWTFIREACEMGEKEKVLEFIGGAPLKELREVFLRLVERVYAHRKANKGYVPVEIFEPCLGMGGVTVSVQIVNEVIGADGKRIGFALKKREANESGDAWKDLYHSTCCTMRMTDAPEDALGRDTKETFGAIPSEKPEFLGVTIHDEPERWSACVTIMHRRKVRAEDMRQFVGEWKIFTEADVRAHDPQIIDHNWYLLEWVLDERRPPFSDVRRGYQR